MTQARADKVEVNARVHAVYDMLLSGLTQTQLIRHCADTWNLSEKQVETYISKARALQMIDAQIEKGNIATALRCIEMQARLLRFELN